ncbi:carboxypeptidase-like regulatory domain-containing protein [Hymenobacter sediminicola]|uniref:Carboxypeptidase-like regulatory domain-containing protein n=1 Tax=Hymenobacter sediminicola TaxID=2761579 RepID=A0A7G7W392_9BACT|nr:carboxypeptidase-like regulatory domain-containing protein [Hymenobacter sediminicola]QNH60835.1 carboxypeptidase-like regulatory domain-containing protein [Hymenobacter sediminicola]
MRNFLLYTVLFLLPHLVLAQQPVARPATAPAKKTEPQPAAETLESTPPQLAETLPAEPVVRVITGNVQNQSGKPLAGVTVSLRQDERQSSITNSAGMFILKTTHQAPVLHVSYAGYSELEVTPPVSGPLVVEMAAIDKYSKQLKKQVKSARKAWEKP